jgi:hypothetical protein
MECGFFRCNVFALFLLTAALPFRADAASAPHKVVFTFGGLSERSGVLFVAQDAGLVQKHGLDASLARTRRAKIPLISGRWKTTIAKLSTWLKHSACVRISSPATSV